MARELVPLGAPPIQEIVVDGKLSTQWSGFFQQLFEYAKGPFISTTSGSQDLAANIEFYPNEGSLVTYMLPTSFNVGDRITIVGFGSGGWQVTQNAGQTIHSPSGSTTTGIAGTLSSTNRYNAVVLMGTIKNTDLVVLSQTGTLSFA